MRPDDIHRRLMARFEVDGWWPVHSAYHETHGTDPREEVAIGAVLVQNTSWRQAERAIVRLAESEALSLSGILALPVDRLTDLVRPAGFPTRKPRTLIDVSRLLLDEAGQGGMDRLVANTEDDPDPLRAALLEVHGIGEETADAILNYAFDAPVIVVDAYMRRLMARLDIDVPTPRGPMDPLKAPYQEVARWWTRGLPRDDAKVYQDLHAAIVEHGKGPCRIAPSCPVCTP
ncbi:MAG: endonuclease [Euryarchaeota archaeon]|nr:endonuclease [Euryarchaeota archaeon]